MKRAAALRDVLDVQDELGAVVTDDAEDDGEFSSEDCGGASMDQHWYDDLDVDYSAGVASA